MKTEELINLVKHEIRQRLKDNPGNPVIHQLAETLLVLVQVEKIELESTLVLAVARSEIQGDRPKGRNLILEGLVPDKCMVWQRADGSYTFNAEKPGKRVGYAVGGDVTNGEYVVETGPNRYLRIPYDKITKD